MDGESCAHDGGCGVGAAGQRQYSLCSGEAGAIEFFIFEYVIEYPIFGRCVRQFRAGEIRAFEGRAGFIWTTAGGLALAGYHFSRRPPGEFFRRVPCSRAFPVFAEDGGQGSRSFSAAFRSRVGGRSGKQRGAEFQQSYADRFNSAGG